MSQEIFKICSPSETQNHYEYWTYVTLKKIKTHFYFSEKNTVKLYYRTDGVDVQILTGSSCDQILNVSGNAKMEKIQQKMLNCLVRQHKK